MHTKVIELKQYNSKEVGLLVQAVLVELAIIFSIISLISKEFLSTFYIIVSMVLFTTAYNNKKFYKKKYMSYIYILMGIFVFVTTLVEYIF